MPLTLGNSQLLNSANHVPSSQSAPINIVRNITNIDASFLKMSVDDKTPTDILVDTPLDRYFSSSTWTLNIVLPKSSNYCNNITIGLNQSSRAWPIGTTCTVNFLLNVGGVEKRIATSVLATQTSQFYKFLISADANGKVSIHKYEYTPLSIQQY